MVAALLAVLFIPDNHDRLTIRDARVESICEGDAISITIDPAFTGSEGQDEEDASRNDLSRRRRGAVRRIEHEMITRSRECQSEQENDGVEARKAARGHLARVPIVRKNTEEAQDGGLWNRPLTAGVTENGVITLP